MKLKLLFFVLLANLVFGQNKQFIYVYKYIPDSTDKAHVNAEMVILNIDKNKSQFFGHQMYASDSTMEVDLKKGVYSMPSRGEYVRYRVNKTLGSKEIEFVSAVGTNRYFAKENIDFNWTILPEVGTYLGFATQKAKAVYAGRTWIAWFTKDISIPDGPYKFCGLPGLIVRLEDTTGSHKYELKGIRNTTSDFVYPFVNNATEFHVTENEYNKVYRNFRKNPVANLVGKIPDQYDASGNFKSGAEILRNLEKIQLEMIAKDNNIIELSLLK